MQSLVLFLLLFSHPQAATSTIHFYGDGYFGTRHVPLYVDGKEIGKIHGRQTLDFQVAPGKHEVRSGDKKSGIILEAKEGADSYVKITMGGSFVLHGQVTLVDPSQGAYEYQARKKDQ
jgi:hypothetical protein